MSDEHYKDFLATIEVVSANYRSIYEGATLVSLTLNFWSWDEVLDGIEKRNEWQVSDNLIPFYGDWHNLYCLDINDGKILSINDAREIQFQWENIASFKSSLSPKAVESPEIVRVVSGRLDF
ncbi:SMI1/KNR4 family protein [Microbulbifer agarilyticus]|uniref:SMI1/KNR4 family protein n=1 Tax=Microbulbifer agarilyticus TaxID=260552 RepID=UPI001C953DB3|nr:SMI1/KNR4 family protein [Microbulbifer agarilyticus]MBY6213311.1 SMI1/KNR4 family protein [Microbulbifer agarilyticus]